MVTLPMSEASRTGISGLVAAAERGDRISISRHGRAVAEVVSTEEMDELRRDRDTLRDAALAMARFATDTGTRTELDDALADFGLSRSELEAELRSELEPR